jgi:cellobiose dehydrogenase (acceptor)
MSQYLGRGVKSRGRMTITGGLTTVVSDLPYLKDDGDKAVVIQGIQNVQHALNKVANLTWVDPPSNMTATDYVNNVSSLPHMLSSYRLN